jgi:hypothetical protein
LGKFDENPPLWRVFIFRKNKKLAVKNINPYIVSVGCTLRKVVHLYIAGAPS